MQSEWMRLYARGFYLGPRTVGFLEDLKHYRRHDLSGAVLYVDEVAGTDIFHHGDDWLITIGKLLPLTTGLIAPESNRVAEELFTLLQREGLAGVESALYDIGGSLCSAYEERARIVCL